MQIDTGYLTQQRNIHSLLGTAKCPDRMSINICQRSFNVIVSVHIGVSRARSQHQQFTTRATSKYNAIDNAPTEIRASYRQGIGRTSSSSWVLRAISCSSPPIPRPTDRPTCLMLFSPEGCCYLIDCFFI